MARCDVAEYALSAAGATRRGAAPAPPRAASYPASSARRAGARRRSPHGDRPISAEPSYPFDGLPIPAIVLLVILASALVYELAFRGGRWYRERTPDEKDGPASMLTGSVLALFAFLLATTMGMASDRFDARRGLVVAEANAIGTTWLRAGFLPAAEAEAARATLVAYARIRIDDPDDATYLEEHATAVLLQRDLWSTAERVAAANPASEPVALFVTSLNELIDVGAERYVARVYARIPATIVWLLLALCALAIAVTGYTSGLTRKRAGPGSAVLVVVTAIVIAIILDLDRPRDGFLTVSQQAPRDLVVELERGAP